MTTCAAPLLLRTTNQSATNGVMRAVRVTTNAARVSPARTFTTDVEGAGALGS